MLFTNANGRAILLIQQQQQQQKLFISVFPYKYIVLPTKVLEKKNKYIYPSFVFEGVAK